MLTHANQPASADIVLYRRYLRRPWCDVPKYYNTRFIVRSEYQ